MRQVELALKISAKLGECPRWDPISKSLYWVDINGFTLNRFDPATGENAIKNFDEEVGCFVLREGGGFVLAMRSGFKFLNSWDAEPEAIIDPEEDLKHNRFNDGRCDPNGRFIAGSVYPPKDIDGANFWSLDKNLQATKIVSDLLTSNGAAFSPDGKIFYYANTPKHVIFACDYDVETGLPSNTRVFHQFPFGEGRPDGASVDVEGHYWTAMYEGSRIARLNPKGDIVEEIELPVKCPTMVAFGDDDMKTLYITSVGDRPAEELDSAPLSGSIFKVRVDVAGLPEKCFVG